MPHPQNLVSHNPDLSPLDGPPISTEPDLPIYCPPFTAANGHRTDDIDPFWSYPAYTAADTTHPSELPLYAPAPLSGQSSSLLSNYQLVKTTLPCLSPDQTSTFPTHCDLLSGGPLAPQIVGPSNAEAKHETTRKARRRAIAQNIGFVPTDPDVISSHEKKRHYLECLEYYVQYLHQQLSLVGGQPAPLQRSNPARGMSSQSIRTLLVHMENVNRRLNQETVEEEQRFTHLRAAVSERLVLQEYHRQQLTFESQGF